MYHVNILSQTGYYIDYLEFNTYMTTRVSKIYSWRRAEAMSFSFTAKPSVLRYTVQSVKWKFLWSTQDCSAGSLPCPL
jgi:hypothetical protein